jgi:hypothetical protein
MAGDFDLSGIFGSPSGFGSTPLGQAARAAERDARKPAQSAPKPLPQIRGKIIDGVFYVRAEDMASCLEATVPSQARRLIAKLRQRS